MTNLDTSTDFKALVRDYRLGRLSAEQERAFEERLMRDPALVEEVELDEALERGLAVAATLVPLRRRAAPAWAMPLAFAATLFVGLGLGLAVARYRGDQPASGGLAVQAVTLDVLRGATERNVHNVQLRAGTELLVLDIATPGLTGTHAVTLDAAGKRRALGSAPVADGFLSIAVPRTALAPGDYRVLIDDEDSRRLTLRVAP